MKLKLPRRTEWKELLWSLGVSTVGMYAFWFGMILLVSFFAGGPSLMVFRISFQFWAAVGGVGALIGAALIALFDLHFSHGFYLGLGMHFGGFLVWRALDYLFPYGPEDSVWAITVLLTCIAGRVAYRHFCEPKVAEMDEEQVIQYAVEHPDERKKYAQRYDAIYGEGSFQKLMEIYDSEDDV